MNDQKPKITLKPKTNPLLAGLSDYLKNPANYEEIEKKILSTFISTCGHTDVMQWAGCKKCTDKMLERRKMLKSLGFKSPRQYMAWKKIHQTIRERFPLMDWRTRESLVSKL